MSKTKAQSTDALHKISRKFVNWCIEQRIKHVVVGDVEGVQRNTKKKRRKTVNEKLSQWQFGQLLKYLEYKLQAKGITLEKVKHIHRKHVLFAPEGKILLAEFISVSAVTDNIVTSMEQVTF